MTGLRTGCDLVDIARFSAAIERRPALLTRLFTERERADARRGGAVAGSEVEHARLAARFAAKEATRKALGDLRLAFHAVEVRTAEDGAPTVYLHGEPADLACSLSHDGGLAMAVVVGSGGPTPAGPSAPVGPAEATGPGERVPPARPADRPTDPLTEA